ncbi:hypothetical protein GOP47_0004592 [Adiantum capillus-veneris]|uniref:Uncharacterized protein n=1 Tax=Adiantum capillus-veneris TaxID=13818 RepID=A0A9D4V8D4_ADICA|nr:hypothetical protein GOP47_0004592 [Adiantum capillus-veneris]
MDEDEDGGFREFATLLKGHSKDMRGNGFFHHHNIRGKGLYNRHRSRDDGFCGRELACDEAFGSNAVGHREGWRHGNNNGFQPACDPYRANEDANNIDLPPHKNNVPFPRIHRGHHPDFGVHDNGHNQQNAQFFGDRFHGKGRGRNYVRGGFAGSHSNGRGYFPRRDFNHKDAQNHNFHGQRQNLQPNSGCKQVKNKVFTNNHAKRGGRAHCFYGSYKRVARSGINEGLQYANKKVNVSNPSPVDGVRAEQLKCKKDGDVCTIQTPQEVKVDGSSCMESEVGSACPIRSPSPLDAGPAEQLECKKNGDVCTIQSLQEAKGDSSNCMESNVQRGCPIRSPASNSCSQSAALCRGEFQKEELSPQKDGIIGFGDQKHLERAFISCSGGTGKRRRSSAVRDFPMLSGRLHISSVKKVIIKSKGKKLNVVRDVVLEDSARACSPSDLLLANEISSFSNPIIVPADHVCPELEDHSKPHLGMIDGSLDLVMSDPETICEVATKIVVDEGNSSAELTQVGFGKVVENCLTLSKGFGGNEQFLGSSEVCVQVACPEESVRVIEADVPEPTVQVLDGKDTQYFELTEVEKVVENCLTLSKGFGGNEVACPEESVDVIEADVPEPTVQSLDGKDTQYFENSSQIPSGLTCEKIPEALDDVATIVSRQTTSQGNSLDGSVNTSKNPSVLTHVKLSEASDVATIVYRQMTSQQNKDLRLKESKKNWRTDMQAVGGLLKSKSRPNKVSGAVTDGLHNHCHVPKKLKVEDSLELTQETGALVPYQSTDGGNVRNKHFTKRLLHKGSHRAKLFQTSKSFDPNDAAKLSSLEASEGVSDRALVKRTLHEFESIRKALVKSQNAVKRADLDAGAMLREKGKWRNCKEKIVGEVPGVEVGDQFSFRMEMHIIGLHRQIQAGIDYIPGTKRPCGSPLATSIVSSGGYEDDRDDGNTLIYSGQGGNNIKGTKKQESNQELVRGNLALTNSMKEKTPVRVIRGTSDLASPSSKVYTYDGLYDVVNYAFECGVAGFWVYQFTLTRRPGQPQVGLSFLTILKKKGLSRPNLLMNDISRGQERLSVCVVNEADEEPVPLHFTYIPSIKYPIWYSPLLPQCCQCAGVCEEETCSCAVKNGGEFPYNEKGYLIRDRKVWYECGPSCSCSSSCMNRVSQKGLRYRLEIFKTKNRGWGVRSLDSIQPGGFICEYTGELLSDAEAEQRVGNDEYLFELGKDCNPSAIESDLADVSSNLAMVPVAEDVAYTIDAKDLGNVARFINHSCSPNLFPQNVLYDSDDLRFPHVMLFAMENIPPMRELTYDYNYSIGHVRDAHGNVKSKACYCGAQDCQGRLY